MKRTINQISIVALLVVLGGLMGCGAVGRAIGKGVGKGAGRVGKGVSRGITKSRAVRGAARTAPVMPMTDDAFRGARGFSSASDDLAGRGTNAARRSADDTGSGLVDHAGDAAEIGLEAVGGDDDDR